LCVRLSKSWNKQFTVYCYRKAPYAICSILVRMAKDENDLVLLEGKMLLNVSSTKLRTKYLFLLLDVTYFEQSYIFLLILMNLKFSKSSIKSRAQNLPLASLYRIKTADTKTTFPVINLRFSLISPMYLGQGELLGGRQNEQLPGSKDL
jgi:hypothetical protein